MYKRILLPVDVFEMDLSDKAVRHAEFLAQSEGEITLLNVLPNSSRSILRGFSADIKKFETFMEEESQKKMKALSRLFSIPASRIHSRVVFGNVRDEIVAIGNADEFDVIVVGSRTPGLSTHLLGSNAESILRYARIPVLVVR
ncbi:MULTISPECIES: universal stress protein [Klebsiella/Raoultella group]|uniref:universal stress protein n=1 Tax=Klebsiella/Raoultella group TaxID=2890311 RepID=UPI0012ADAD2F|nr:MULTISPECIES: universal stress protein [Klebsiella/Raoultella group]MRT48786.1 universal stress protein UspG [Raoultella sp. RIT712]